MAIEERRHRHIYWSPINPAFTLFFFCKGTASSIAQPKMGKQVSISAQSYYKKTTQLHKRKKKSSWWRKKSRQKKESDGKKIRHNWTLDGQGPLRGECCRTWEASKKGLCLLSAGSVSNTTSLLINATVCKIEKNLFTKIIYIVQCSYMYNHLQVFFRQLWMN